MIYNSMRLLIEMLQENSLHPEKLNHVLTNYVFTVEEAMKMVNDSNDEEVILISLKDILNTIESFNHLIDFSAKIHYLSKADSKPFD